jgi:hypothetical protein
MAINNPPEVKKWKQASKYLRLNGFDFIKGLIFSATTSATAVIYSSLDAGVIEIDWKSVKIAALCSGVAYLFKNLLKGEKQAKNEPGGKENI